MKTFCSYYNQQTCQSCELIAQDYASQLKHKEEYLKNQLSSLTSLSLTPSVDSKLEHFRNKAKLVVTGTQENPIIGLWGEEDLDQGRELLNCPLHVEQINQVLNYLIKFIKTTQLVPYQIAQKKGELKGFILFYSEHAQEGYLRIILRSKESIDRIRKHTPQLIEKFPFLKCISVNLQPVAHAILEGEEEIFLTSSNSISLKLGEMNFSLGPRAFVQTNQNVAQKLYATAAQWVKESHFKKFLELYCGQGPFSFFSAPYIEQGLGVEINPDAIKVANLTAQEMNLSHLSFTSADAAQVGELVKVFHPEIILVNPPRRGLADACDLLIENKPQMIIYSSCNSDTLLSDLKKLDFLYEIKKIQMFDMFPHTKHFETLVELRLRKSV